VRRFHLALGRARLTQVDAAKLFGVDDRTVRRWARGTTPVPAAVMIVLNLVDRNWCGITLDDVEYIANRISIEELNARKDLKAAQRRLDEIKEAKVMAEVKEANAWHVARIRAETEAILAERDAANAAEPKSA
jgi:transcriptional regulator with XRE-family HTH domain